MMPTGEEPADAVRRLAAARGGDYELPKVSSNHREHGEHCEPGVTNTTRTVTYRDREIEIETTYRVTIDGEPLEGTLEVLDDGRVQYNGLPHYALPSAMDILQRVIDHAESTPPVADELGAPSEEDRP